MHRIKYWPISTIPTEADDLQHWQLGITERPEVCRFKRARVRSESRGIDKIEGELA